MTIERLPAVPLWLDPWSTDVSHEDPPAISRSQLEMRRRRVLEEPLTAQRLITASPRGLTLTDEGDTGESALLRWGLSLPSAVAVLMPTADSESSQAASRTRRKYQERLLTSQNNWPDLATSIDTAFLLCADHKPPEYGLPKQLYREHSTEGLIPWDGIPPLLNRLTKVVSPVLAPAWIDSQSSLREALATIIAESFKNTHDHARQQVDGGDLPTSVRALYARYYPLAEVLDSISSLTPSEITPADRYIRAFTPRPVKRGVRAPDQPSISGFLELSVLDSGPGMAARWLRQPVHDISPKEQLAAILQCFGKGRTTTGASGRGFGLWKVLLSLSTLHGFISIRTNSIHAYRQFGYFSKVGHEQMPGGAAVPKEHLYDWKRVHSTEPSNYPHVKGTVVSFIIPMGQA